MDVFVISVLLTGFLVPVLLHYIWPNFMEEIFEDPPLPPYRIRTRELGEDIILKGILADMGGVKGPRMPQLVFRSLVRRMRRNGFEVVLTDNGRECVYFEWVGGKRYKEKVLMARKSEIRE